MARGLKALVLITICLSVLAIGLTILDFSALHDIKKDYVSRTILKYLSVTLSDDLPDWTATRAEWQMVAISLYLRFLFLALNTGVLVLFYKRSVSKGMVPSELFPNEGIQ